MLGTVMVAVLAAVLMILLFLLASRSVSRVLARRRDVKASPRPRIALGHALESNTDPVVDAVAIVLGRAPLCPRAPRDIDAVERAEAYLGVLASSRPIYAFLGDLHPDLGKVGLICSISWADRVLVGVSRCDTGGLGGRRGPFSCLKVTDVETALAQLNVDISCWHDGWHDELTNCYDEVRDYVAGTRPKEGSLDSVREQCIAYAVKTSQLDMRRLWTWELRLDGTVLNHEISHVVLSPEAHKVWLDCIDNEASLPDVTVLYGSVDGNGIHFFDQDEVIDAFMVNT